MDHDPGAHCTASLSAKCTGEVFCSECSRQSMLHCDACAGISCEVCQDEDSVCSYCDSCYRVECGSCQHKAALFSGCDHDGCPNDDGSVLCGSCLLPCDICRIRSCDEHLTIDDEAGVRICSICLPPITMAVEQVVRLVPALPEDCARIITTFLGGADSLEVWEDALEEGIMARIAERRRRALTVLLTAPLTAWVARRRRDAGKDVDVPPPPPQHTPTAGPLDAAAGDANAKL